MQIFVGKLESSATVSITEGRDAAAPSVPGMLQRTRERECDADAPPSEEPDGSEKGGEILELVLLETPNAAAPTALVEEPPAHGYW